LQSDGIPERRRQNDPERRLEDISFPLDFGLRRYFLDFPVMEWTSLPGPPVYSNFRLLSYRAVQGKRNRNSPG
jgi:hypothetical protein